jgi:SAM-dependent methyltransferase
VDAGRLDEFAFASRKRPEFMHHRLVLCNRCDLLFANPAPTPVSLERAYRAASYDSAVESKYASLTYAAQLDHLLPTLPTEGGAVDIGTGDGAFLARLLERGFRDVIGIEPSEAPITHATPEVAVHIRRGAFDPGDFPPGRFRLVTCFQTLEHVDDPVALCRGALRLLQPGGALFVVSHDRRAPLNRVLGRKSPIYDIEHLQLYSPPALRALFVRSGFCAVRHWAVHNRYPLRYWTSLAPLPMPLRKWLATGLDRLGLASLPVSLPVGNLAVVGYKPPG